MRGLVIAAALVGPNLTHSDLALCAHARAARSISRHRDNAALEDQPGFRRTRP
jgi:hypothetical protein